MSEVQRYEPVTEFGIAVMDESPTGRFVSHEDYAGLQQKLDALTADNFGLSSAAYTLLQMLNEPYGLPDAVARMEKALENPATDAQVNALSAEGAKQQLTTIDNELGKLAGAMLNRTLDTSSKQAVGYAECAAMVAKFAAQLRNGEHVGEEG